MVISINRKLFFATIVLTLMLFTVPVNAGWFDDLTLFLTGRALTTQSNNMQDNPADFSMKSETSIIEIDQIYYEDVSIEINRIIYGISVDAKVDFQSEAGLARFVLVTPDREYLIYESYPRISDKDINVINNACEETCALYETKDGYLRVEVEDAIVEIKSINLVDSYDKLDSDVKAKGVAAYNEEIKNEQDLFKIKKINEKELSWIAGETSVSGMSYQEKKRLFGVGDIENLPNLQGFEYYKGGIFEVVSGTEAVSGPEQEPSSLPEGWDWRDRHGVNWVTPVTDQESCGSCWAFAAVGATELLANLYFNDPELDLDLSEQQITSCADDDGCHGGWPSAALDYIRDNGVTEETCLPYVAIDASGCTAASDCIYDPVLCKDTCKEPTERIKIYGRIPFVDANEETLKRMIIEQGAVSGGIGPWSHAMNLVGYGAAKEGDIIYLSRRGNKIVKEGDRLIGEQYWIFKNSWGADWGEDGFAKIKVSMFKIAWTHALESPVYSEEVERTINCVDKDGDRYCNWGISENMPSTCDPSLSCNTEKDCDDSKEGLGAFDENYNCIDISS